MYSRFQNKSLLIIITFNCYKAFNYFSFSSKQTNQFLMYFTLLDLHEFVDFLFMNYSLNETTFHELKVTEPSEDDLQIQWLKGFVNNGFKDYRRIIRKFWRFYDFIMPSTTHDAKYYNIKLSSDFDCAF